MHYFICNFQGIFSSCILIISSSSYSRSGSSRSRSSSYSITSSSSGSVRRERRKHKAESRKAMAEEAAAARQNADKSIENLSTEQPTEKEDGVNFGLSGKLLEDTNTVNGVVVKYSEPQEARKPRTKWRLYVFKGNEELPILYIHRQSAYLLGRDRKVADIPLDHPSCSKQVIISLVYTNRFPFLTYFMTWLAKVSQELQYSFTTF